MKTCPNCDSPGFNGQCTDCSYSGPVQASATASKLLACPACSRTVSAAAAACVGCGHPLAGPKKDKGTAALLSVVLPGAGTIYAGRVGFGVLLMLAWMALVVFVIAAGNPLAWLLVLLLYVAAIDDAVRTAARTQDSTAAVPA